MNSIAFAVCVLVCVVGLPLCILTLIDHWRDPKTSILARDIRDRTVVSSKCPPRPKNYVILPMGRSSKLFWLDRDNK